MKFGRTAHGFISAIEKFGPRYVAEQQADNLQNRCCTPNAKAKLSSEEAENSSIYITSSMACAQK